MSAESQPSPYEPQSIFGSTFAADPALPKDISLEDIARGFVQIGGYKAEGGFGISVTDLRRPGDDTEQPWHRRSKLTPFATQEELKAYMEGLNGDVARVKVAEHVRTNYLLPSD